MNDTIELKEKPLSTARAQLLASWLKQQKGVVLQFGWRSLKGKYPADVAAKLGLDVDEVRKAAGPGGGGG